MHQSKSKVERKNEDVSSDAFINQPVRHKNTMCMGGGGLKWLDRLAELTGVGRTAMDGVSEIRMRAGHPLQLRYANGGEAWGQAISLHVLQEIVNLMTGNSLYACEQELRQGYFTAIGGWRVGVCGRFNAGSHCIESIANIGSLCIRIPREVKGCAAGIYEAAMREHPASILILSRPGMGKTTIMRDLVRLASEGGYNVAVVDERREIAACIEGVPQLDVGNRTDVLDGCPKSIALGMLIRACAPDMIAVDEIGGADDAEAIRDAVRSGITVAATAHASGLEDAWDRKHISELLRTGVFDWCVTLGPQPGRIKSMRRCADLRFDDAEGNFAFRDSACMCCSGKKPFQCEKAQI